MGAVIVGLPLRVVVLCALIVVACYNGFGGEQGVTCASLGSPSSLRSSPPRASLGGLLKANTMTTVSDPASRRRRHGPAPLSLAEKRTHTVSVRLNASELADLDQRRGPVRMQRGEYLRAAALHHLPPVISPIAREQWQYLARTAANLNQIAGRMNMGGGLNAEHLSAELADCLRLLQMVRGDLIGAKLDAEDEKDEGES